MKGNCDVVKVLNEVLRKELIGVNQYFIHAKMCKNWGYAVLGEHAWNESIDEMKHADQIVERILFLEACRTFKLTTRSRWDRTSSSN